MACVANNFVIEIMAHRKVIFLMDSGEALQSLARFSLNNICLPGDLKIALFYQELFNTDIENAFRETPLPHLEYSYAQIFEKIFSISSISKAQQKEVLDLLEKCKVQPKLNFENEALQHCLYEETLFADLLLCTTSTLQKVLAYESINTQIGCAHFNCPTLVIPDTAHEIKNIFLVFDGKPTSMKAIKDFNYMLSHLYEGCEVTIISTTNNQEREQYEDKLLMQYAKLHIPDVGFMKIVGNEIVNIIEYIKKTTDTLLVFGATGSVDGLIQKSSLEYFEQPPIFITKN